MSWTPRCAAMVVLVAVAGLVLTSCSWLSPPPTPTVSDIVGLWKSDRLDAVLVMRDDMTFDARNVPAGYLFKGEPYGVDPTERFAVSGTWEASEVSPSIPYSIVFVSFRFDDKVESNELGLQFSGDHLERLYLTKGDPDNGDRLSFYREEPTNGPSSP